MKCIELQNVTRSFSVNHDKIFALKEIDLSIEKGELLSVMGRSGSGKSTLINIIAGLLRADSGKVLFEGKSIDALSNKELLHYRRDNVGLIVQNYALLEEESVFDNVALPLKLRKASIATIKKTVAETLDIFNISDKSKVPICKLSGGQKQRVAIARAMCYKPNILLADEPTAALDIISEREIMQWFLKINNSGTTIVLVTHDPEIAKQCDRTIFLDNGSVSGNDCYLHLSDSL